MDQQARHEEAYEALASASLRLSPVERRNLELINDPAIAGYSVAGCSKGTFSSPSRAPGAPVPAREEEAFDPSAYEDDGCAYYTKDGRELVKFHGERERYEVAAGCERIGDRAFDSVERLASVTLPDTLRSIGRLAFAKTGLTELRLPGSLRSVGEKAFLHCSSLLACDLPEGLLDIEESAFAFTGIAAFHLPASVRLIGAGAFDRTPAEREVEKGSITVSSRNPFYQIDRAGGIYRSSDLVQLLSVASAYEVMPGCSRIAPGAALRNRCLKEALLPETVTEVGDDAFRGCRFLHAVHLPRSLERIGDRAFMDTRIEALSLGPHVEHIGAAALLVQGERPGRPGRGLKAVDLDPANRHFYEESGLLCERGGGDGGADMAVLYIGPDAVVAIPEQVNRLAPYALSGATAIEELHVHDHMHSICECSLAVGKSIRTLHVAFPKSAGGYEEDEVIAPSLTTRFHDLTAFFTTNEAGTVFVYPLFDAWAATAHDVAEMADAAMGRLSRPVALDEDARKTYLSLLTRKQEAVCRVFASRGDLTALEQLMAWGVLSLSTVQDASQKSIQEGDAQATACLLELSRRHGASAGFDRSL